MPPEVNHCHFFNPFSAQILNKAMARILESYYQCPRKIILFFYYPSDAFISHLMTIDALEFYSEILCEDLFEKKDLRERIPPARGTTHL